MTIVFHRVFPRCGIPWRGFCLLKRCRIRSVFVIYPHQTIAKVTAFGAFD